MKSSRFRSFNLAVYRPVNHFFVSGFYSNQGRNPSWFGGLPYANSQQRYTVTLVMNSNPLFLWENNFAVGKQPHANQHLSTGDELTDPAKTFTTKAFKHQCVKDN
jgi:hypothetical protein